MDRELLIEKIEEYLSLKELSIYFDVPYTTVRYYVTKYKLKTKGHSNETVWTNEKILSSMINAKSKGDILDNMGFTRKSGNYQTLYKYCLKYDINIDDIEYKNENYLILNKKLKHDEIFTENSCVSSTTPKRVIIRDNLKKYKCEKCGNNGEWMGEKISLQLDHINGVRCDNRLENLRFLCPNCHSQTSTYSGKNKK
jgi:predicted RNA-binding Zn-ribbon protein involved in translation (DUF1610 family)